jgi:hypothetical protein
MQTREPRHIILALLVCCLQKVFARRQVMAAWLNANILIWVFARDCSGVLGLT